MRKWIIKKKNKFLLILIILAFGTICWDISTSVKYSAVEGTFKYESEFDAVTGATTKVAIVPSDYTELTDPISRTVNPSYAQVEAMVREAIELQGGLDWVITPGDKVMLKVNLVGANSPSGQGENTDVRVVKALIKIIDEHTAGNVEIVVAEGSARVNDAVDEAATVWDNSGYQDLLTDSYLTGINFRLLNLNQTYADLVEITLGNKATAAPHGGKYHVHKEEIDADVFISVPVLKIHDTGITNALKNQIGTAPGVYYGYNKMKGSSYYTGLVHDDGHRRWTCEEIVDLSYIADVDFVVVDAIMTLEKYKAYSTSEPNQVRFNSIVAGADPVAVDHVCTRLVCLNPDDIAHITLAEKIGLGTNDPEKIEIVGATVDAVKKQVVKNDAENGKFGQSNRTWLLSEPFISTDMASQQIANEATYEPIGGEGSWSEPVFFFDDRIDLISFYSGQEGIISYAFSYFYSPADQAAELWVGSHEDIKVYINGNQVYNFTGINVYGDNDIYTEIEPIVIKKGENTLMVKTLNEYNDYSFALNICEVESDVRYQGNRVNGLKFYTVKDTAGGSLPVRIEELAEVGSSLNCYPNPVADKTNINFILHTASKISVDIYDMEGKLIACLADAFMSAGKHSLTWYTAVSTQAVKPGMYVCTLRGGDGLAAINIVVK